MNTAFIDVSRINENYTLLSKRKELFCVVKSDAYGHGLLPVAEALYESGARAFCVIYPEEGMALLSRFPDATVLFLSLPDKAFLLPLIERGAVFSVSDGESAVRLATLARGRALARVHIACDSGMGRLGFPLFPEAYDRSLSEILSLLSLDGLSVEGVYSHLPVSEGALYECCLSRFTAAVQDLLPHLPEALFHLTATSSHGRATVSLPPSVHTASRVGMALYGYGTPGVRSAMTVRSAVLRVCDLPAGTSVGYGGDAVLDAPHRVATVGIGYADGLPRLAEGAYFSFGDARLPLVGRVSMNLATVLADGVPLHVGDTVTVLGESGRETLALADASGRIPYELLLMGSRMKRIYI